jgi:AsmA-like protein
MKGLLAWIARLVHYVAFTAACLLVAVAALLLGLERSGWMTGYLKSDLAGRLGQAGGQLEIEGTSLDWFGPSLELRGVSLGAGGRLLHLERVRVTFDVFPFDRIGPRRIDLEGGRARLSQELLDAILALQASAAPAPSLEGPPPKPTPLPRITVRDVRADLSHPQWGDIPLGLVDLICASDEQGRPRLEGRLMPSLAPYVTPEAAIYVGGQEDEPGLFSVHLSTEGMAIGADSLPAGTVLEQFRAYEPRGLLKLEAHARISLDKAVPHRADLRVSIAGGSFRSPTSPLPVEGLVLDIDARCNPITGESWTTPNAWESRAVLQAGWASTPIRGSLVFGRSAGPGLLARGSLRASELPLQRPTLDAFGLRTALEPAWVALDPRGSADVACAVRYTTSREVQLALDAAFDGRAAMTFHGFVDEKTARQVGFPLPVDQGVGRFVAVHDPAQARPSQIGLIGLRGAHSGGTRESHPAWCEGLALVPHHRDHDTEFDIRFGGSNVAVDEELRRGLAGIPGTAWIWPAFSPRAGNGSVDAHVRKLASEPWMAASFLLEVRDAVLAWDGLPVPIEAAAGTIRVALDPRPRFGAGFDLHGVTATSEAVRLQGHVQEEAQAPPSHEPNAEHLVQTYSGSAKSLSLRGSDRNVVVATWPGVGAALEQFAPAGKADVHFTGSRSGAGLPFEYQVEVVPLQVQLTPQTFNMTTRNVRGRVLLTGRVPPAGPGPHGSPQGARPLAVAQVETRLAPLVGDWGSDARVACIASFPFADSGASERIELFGAGIDVTNRAWVGAFREAFARGEGGYGGLDLTALSVDGRVDFAGEIEIPRGAPAQPRSRYRVYLRDNDFQTTEREGSSPGFGLRSLRGVLVQEDEVLRGERIGGVLGRTPIELEGARFGQRDGRYELATHVRARDLPLDREHLSPFLDPRTIETLIERMHLRGSLDIPSGDLTLSGRTGEAGRLTFRGQLVPQQMMIDLGLPLEIERASVDLRQLVYEDGHVRAWAAVDALEGSIARRRIEDASLLLTYVEPHLSILDLDGRLEGGSIRDAGGASQSPGASGGGGEMGGPAFAIDLREPFGFELGLRLRNVDVAGLLRGLFESDFADSGVLDSDLRLAGSLQKLTGITGDGSVDLRDTRLWSIPVIRDLFAQLGFDNTAVFERMRTRFRLAEGVIHMDAIHVESPLLQLVGSGTLDLDGRLRHDLQVRYGLVDRLGPLTRFLYWIQNNLLSVSVRGDMARPKIVLKGMLSLLRGEQSGTRELPLPDFAPIPERF